MFLSVIFLRFNFNCVQKSLRKLKSLPLLIVSFSIRQTLIFSPLVHLMEVEIRVLCCVLLSSHLHTVIVIHQAASELWGQCR